MWYFNSPKHSPWHEESISMDTMKRIFTVNVFGNTVCTLLGDYLTKKISLIEKERYTVMWVSLRYGLSSLYENTGKFKVNTNIHRFLPQVWMSCKHSYQIPYSLASMLFYAVCTGSTSWSKRFLLHFVFLLLGVLIGTVSKVASL